MGIMDRIGSIVDRLGIGSEGYDARDAQREDDDGYGYEEEYDEGYEDDLPPEDGGIAYEPSYGSSGNVMAGARPASSRQKNKGGVRGLIERAGAKPPPRQKPRSNVIEMGASPAEYDEPVRETRMQPRGYSQEAYPEERNTRQDVQLAARTDYRPPSTLIFLVRRLSEAEDIIGHMLDGGNVIINMEEIDEGLKRRMLDMISGAAYALGARISRISYHNYFVAMGGEEIVSNVTMRERDPEEDSGGFRSRARY